MFIELIKPYLTHAQLKCVQTMPAALVESLEQSCQQVSALSHGLSNDNFRLHCIGGDKVLRINRQTSEWCDRALEVETWQLAYAQELAPKLLWHAADYQTYLSEFIVPQQASNLDEDTINDWSSLYAERGCRQIFSTFVPDEREQKSFTAVLLASMLTELHSLPLPSKAISTSEQYQNYWQRLLARKARLEAASQTDDAAKSATEWLALFKQLKEMQPRVEGWLAQMDASLIKPCYCHLDLNPYNILPNTTVCGQPRLQCIDFEYAIASHPLFDLASVIATHDLDAHATQQLISDYLSSTIAQSHLTNDAVSAIESAVNLFWLFAVMWALLMFDMALYESHLDEIHRDETQSDKSLTYLDYAKQYLTLIAMR
ncbi:hypothetical protein EXU30_01530 [Shewanella maritima]|uniref:Aminoglycoside phosphotransferase domain-containing protein n=1 Tax=Shewanella maritima TaxID=2520507 RepID=A0A411PD51_9GAMM|nr:phosphotransferase [Shewanella maritima]QBF81527.1 hypothetical protein EXU30_01530 [Shewanella maritima]